MLPCATGIKGCITGFCRSQYEGEPRGRAIGYLRRGRAAQLMHAVSALVGHAMAMKACARCTGITSSLQSPQRIALSAASREPAEWEEFEVEGLEVQLRSSRDRTEIGSVRFVCQSGPELGPPRSLQNTQSNSQSPQVDVWSEMHVSNFSGSFAVLPACLCRIPTPHVSTEMLEDRSIM